MHVAEFTELMWGLCWNVSGFMEFLEAPYSTVLSQLALCSFTTCPLYQYSRQCFQDGSCAQGKSSHTSLEHGKSIHQVSTWPFNQARAITPAFIA